MNALQTSNTYTKIIRYRLDDKQYFTDLLKRENTTEQAVTEIIGDKEYFTAIFTLYGYERNGHISIDRYELTNNNGQKISINSLNGYEHGIIINECYRHFYGHKADLHGTFEIVT